MRIAKEMGQRLERLFTFVRDPGVSWNSNEAEREVRIAVVWGDQLSNGSEYLQDGYWWLIYPVGACIVLTVMALNFIGDGVAA